MVNTASETKIAAFRFLDLPAELRNRVYAFCHEEPQTDIREIVHFNKRTMPVARDVNASSTRSFASFTQTCRQIRSEFRPLYMEQNEVHLWTWNVEDYLKTFATGRGTPFKIAVDVSFTLSTTNALHELIGVGLLVAQYQEAPSDNYRFEYTPDRNISVERSHAIASDINFIFKEQRVFWEKFLDHPITGLDFDPRLARLAFSFNPGFLHTNIPSTKKQIDELLDQLEVKHVRLLIIGGWGKTSERKLCYWAWDTKLGVRVYVHPR